MTKNTDREPEPREKPSKDKKPRGMGGVFVILLLLLALFFVVNRSAEQSRRSNYDFWYLLHSGKLDKVTLGTEDVVTAEYVEGQDRVKIQTTFKQLTPAERATIQMLQAFRMDQEYYRSGGMSQFLQDVDKDLVKVRTCWLITQTEPRRPPAREARGRQRRSAEVWLSAVVLRGNEVQWVRVPQTDSPGAAVTVQQVVETLEKAGVEPSDVALGADDSFEIEKVDALTVYLIGTIGPWILIIGLFWFFIIRQMRSPGGAGGVLSFGRSRVSRYNKEQRTHVTFDDVEGMDEAKEEVREVIEFLKNPNKFKRLGGRIPRGILLVGPPGTGKTLLAKAIAGEADVPFFSISGSDFVEMFVGVGASRVRDLFKQARDNAPCIVFLDEIDAVGRKRGTGLGGGHDEREQTLNAILVEMDGFDTDEGIILIGATNRPDVLDPALLRPGRFDRQVVIDMPDVKGREAILRVHARKVKVGASVDYDKLARATPGFSGAELAALINEAAILAGMAGGEAIEHSHLEEARDRVRWGREKRSRKMQEEDRKVTAYHEAGHALVGARIPEIDPVHKVTIIARGQALGATMYLPEKDDYHLRRSKLIGMIAMSYGGRIAEHLVFHDVSAGAQNDIVQATRIARMMVAEWGMSEAVGPLNYAAPPENSFLGHDFRFGHEHSDDTAKLIDTEVKKVCDEAYDRARQILVKDRAILDHLAQALMRYETITGEEVKMIVEGRPIDTLRDEPKAPKAGVGERVKPQARPAAEPQPDLPLSGAEGLATS